MQSLKIDITPPVNQADRGHGDKPISDRYQFHAKMPAKSTIYLRQASCLFNFM